MVGIGNTQDEQDRDESTSADSAPPSASSAGPGQFRREELFRSMYEHAAVGIVQVAVDGRLLMVNAALCRMLGYSESELLGKTCEQITYREDYQRETPLLEAMLRGERESYEIEKRYLHRNGSPVWVNLTSSPVKDAKGRTSYRTSIIQDITERKQAQEALRESEERYRNLFNSMDEGFCVIEMIFDSEGRPADYRFLKINAAFEAQTGLHNAEGKLMRELAPAHEAHWFEIYGRIALTGEPAHFLNEAKALGRYYDVRAYRVGEPEQRQVAIVFNDISALKRAEEEREATIEFLGLVNRSQGTRDLIQRATTFFQERSGCQAVGIRLREGDDFPYFEARGFSKEFVLAESKLCARDDSGEVVRDAGGNPLIECMCGNVICGRFEPSKPFFTAQGSFWTNSTTELLAGTTEADRQSRTRNRCNGEGYESVALIPLHVGEERFGLLQLNDRQKGRFSAEVIALWERLAGYLATALSKFRADEALQQSEAQFRALAEGIPQLAWMANAEGWIFWYNQRWYQYTGTTSHQMEGWGWQSVHDPVALPKVMERWTASIATAEPFDMVFPLRGANGEFRPFLTRVMPVKDATGKVVRWFGTNTDISEQKRVEEALRAQAELLNLAHDTILVRDLDGTIQYWNDGGEEMYGFSKQQAIGRVSHDLLRTVFPKPLAEIEADILRVGHWEGDLIHTCQDGNRIVVASRWVAQHDQSGQVCAIMETNNDITARKRAEDTLRDNENRLRLALDAGSMATWDLNLASDENVWNDEMYRLLGYEPQSTPASHEVWARRVLAEDFPKAEAMFSASLEQGVDLRSEYRVLGQNDEVRWVEARGRSERDENGNVVRSFGVVMDITGRKRAESVLQTTLQRFYLILSNMYSGVLLVTDEGRVEFANRAFCDRFGLEDAPADLAGYASGEMLDKIKNAYRHPDQAVARIREILDRAEPVTSEELAMQGGKTCLRDFAPLKVDGKSFGRMWIHTDITERKQAEDALREREVLLRTVTESSRVGLVMLSNDRRYLYANAAYAEVLGLSTPDIIGKRVPDVMGHVYDQISPRLDRAFAGERVNYELTVPVRQATGDGGRNRFYAITYEPLLGHGEGSRLIVVVVDITERKQAEEALRSSQAKLQGIIGSAMDAVVSVDEHQCIVVFNRAAEAIFQCPASEALGSSLDRFIPKAMRDAHREHLRHFGIQGATARSMTSPAILSALRSNGEEFPIEATISQVQANGERLYTVILRDITVRKQAEEALIRSEKLASVGRMAASISHEINNPLGAVTNLLYLAKATNEMPDSARRYLEIADEELKRVAHITQQSLGFYRESTAPARTSVNAVLQSAIDVLGGKIKAKQAVVEKQWDGDVEITAVAGELRQVFSNLLANSLDAIGEKGVIKLRVSTGAALNNGHRCVRVTIADNGKGISASVRRQIFEPFVTTKGTTGTGLGLWVSKQLIDKHEGSIRVRSNTDGTRSGTVFSVTLPVGPGAAADGQSAGV